MLVEESGFDRGAAGADQAAEFVSADVRCVWADVREVRVQDGSAETTLEEALDGRPTVLVLGSEGEGIRRLVAEHCDTLAKIPMPGGFESLNVSTAAAVALYEAARPRA